MASNPVPEMLRSLWRKRAQNLASNVASGNREHREIAHAASLIRQDYHDRFLVELIQNASDQGSRGGDYDSTVVVIRTKELLAVSNGGQVVTDTNLERLSSLADSDKNGMLIGNKGVGFKAVYQITDAPEIFSSSEERGTNGEDTLSRNFRLGFALEKRPFENAILTRAIEEDIREYFEENSGIAKAIRAGGDTDPVNFVRPEFAHVAGFKFPLARTAEDLARRIRELNIPEDLQETMRTLVVLPIRDEKAEAAVDQAVESLVGRDNGNPGQIELAILFLAGVGMHDDHRHSAGLAGRLQGLRERHRMVRQAQHAGLVFPGSRGLGQAHSEHRQWHAFHCAAPRLQCLG